jgi:hypothetical protein
MVSTRLFKVLLSGMVLAAGASLMSSSDTPSGVLDPSPKKIMTTVVLRPHNAGEDIRYVYLAEDGKTKSLTLIEYRSGVTSYTFHRADGTAEKTKEFYPPEKGETQRQLKSQVDFDTDGKSFLSQKTFRLDGSVEGVGERTAEGQYQTQWFFEDGTTLNKNELYDAERRLLSKDEYRKDGSVASQSRRASLNELVSKYYSQKGNNTHEFTVSRWNVLSGAFYNDDGTLRVRFMDAYGKLNSQYFDKGTLTLEVEYFRDFMEVTSYAEGKQLRKQIWTRIGSRGEECTAAYKLFKVEGAWQKSSDKSKYTKQNIEMNEEGTHAVSVETIAVSYSTSGSPSGKKELRTRTVKILLPDGSVSFVKDYNEDILLSERPGTAADSVDIKTLISKPDFECLPIPSKAERNRAQSSFL